MEKIRVIRYTLIIVLALGIGTVARAATINVTTTQDNVAGSLRAAITTANTNGEDDTIHLPAGTYILTGEGKDENNYKGDLDIDNADRITIIGEGIAATIIDGNQVDRCLHIRSGTVSISGVTFRNGNTNYPDAVPGAGGAICISLDCQVTLSNCKITDNSCVGNSGGGVFNRGRVTLTNCTIKNNAAGSGTNPGDGVNEGGGISNRTAGTAALINCTINNNTSGKGGGIRNKGRMTLTNCTIYENKTGPGDYCAGGGINNMGTLTVTNCTIKNNQTKGKAWQSLYGGSGGGIYNVPYNTRLYLKNTIVADNQVRTGAAGPDCYGKINSQGYNLIENKEGFTITGKTVGNILGQDPKLNNLANNGGPTKTCALAPDSPAVDAGDSSGTSEDQRGYSRPVDLPGISNASDGADIGAYEFNTTYIISGTITYGETGLPGVTVTFSNSAGTAVTNNEGNYSHTVLYGWSGTITPSKEGYTFSPSSKSYTSITADQPNQNYTAYPTIPPQISLNRTQLNFGVDNNGNQSGSQNFLITNSGGGILYWTINDDADWLDFTPISGSGSAVVTTSINPSGLSTGTYTSTITVEDPNASNSPQTVGVTLSVYNANATGNPFGYFETPIDGSTVRSSIPVTGWALDDIEIMNVKIYRREGTNLVYIGDAVLVEGARPDVEQAYPEYPNCYKAGWGYMMLTNFLPNGGNGSFTLHAIATDIEGNQVTLGIKTILCDNANAVKPFGAIDTPTQGGTALGSDYVNFGWALTPLPNTIPTNGSTIQVWVDGVSLGNPIYNQYREDIATLFPNYNNSNGAVGYFYLDTTLYENGVHTIAWSAEDDAGNADGIGSRYFTIQNSGASSSSGVRGQGSVVSGQGSVVRGKHTLSNIPVDDSSSVGVIKGFTRNVDPLKNYPDENGNITIEIRELERLEVRLFTVRAAGLAPLYSGYQVIGDRLTPLPIGSTLDRERGIFHWQPGPGFFGDFEFIFIEKRGSGKLNIKIISIRVKIIPKFLKE